MSGNSQFEFVRVIPNVKTNMVGRERRGLVGRLHRGHVRRLGRGRVRGVLGGRDRVHALQLQLVDLLRAYGQLVPGRTGSRAARGA